MNRWSEGEIQKVGCDFKILLSSKWIVYLLYFSLGHFLCSFVCIGWSLVMKRIQYVHSQVIRTYNKLLGQCSYLIWWFCEIITLFHSNFQAVAVRSESLLKLFFSNHIVFEVFFWAFNGVISGKTHFSRVWKF